MKVKVITVREEPQIKIVSVKGPSPYHPRAIYILITRSKTAVDKSTRRRYEILLNLNLNVSLRFKTFRNSTTIFTFNEQKISRKSSVMTCSKITTTLIYQVKSVNLSALNYRSVLLRISILIISTVMLVRPLIFRKISIRDGRSLFK